MFECKNANPLDTWNGNQVLSGTINKINKTPTSSTFCARSRFSLFELYGICYKPQVRILMVYISDVLS